MAKFASRRVLPVLGPALARFGAEVGRAVGGPALVAREAEITGVFEVLLRQRNNNAVLIGPPGAGKSALVTEVARRLALPGAPDALGGRILVQLDVHALVAGAQVRGQLEDRIAAVVKELISYDGGLIPVFDDLAALLERGPLSEIDLLHLLGPVLETGSVPALATVDERLDQHPHLERRVLARFQPIRLAGLTEAETVAVLSAHAPALAAHHGLSIDEAALTHAARLAQRYVRHRALPDSALSLLDQAGACARLAQEPAGKISVNDVAAVASRWSSVPLQRLLDDEASRLVGLERILHQRVVGQEAALSAVANAARRARTQLHDPTRPLGSFMFLGPTGVGKTELARVVSAVLFEDDSALVRIDMSEYMERHQVARLIGAPPGYVGYGEGGQLTDAVRLRPYCVVLLDELEKAHPDVFNLLLQIMEDGRLTDGQGRTVDFRHTMLILTSNCGSEHIVHRDRPAGQEGVRERVMDAVRKQFRPEFLNRIDEIVVFNRLSRDVIRRVVDIQVSRLQQRLDGRGIRLVLTPSAREWLAEHGHDPDYGARPLRRLIRREVEEPLALLMLSDPGALGRGQVEIDAEPAGSRLVLRTAG